MFHRVLIANRGEIAVRVARTCHELGVEVVAVYSDADAHARHVAVADGAVRLPGVAPADTYLNVGAILDAARRTGAEAVHPGYGFLSERADVAEAVSRAGLIWIGPPPSAARAAGDKVEARRLAASISVAPVPGTLDAVRDAKAVLDFASEHGFPVAIKAAGGGGGRGLKVAATKEGVEDALGSAAREAEAYFGYGDVYLERYLPHPKHLEVQVLSIRPGTTLWLGARDCSLQRRHQKLIEETPPALFERVVPAMGEAARRVADACGYVNAGTVEFLLDTDDGSVYFLEVNARLQVEHTITEQVTGIDLVAAQLRIAAGDDPDLSQADLAPGGRHAARGHAIECRINAEDPARRFLPRPGRLSRYREPGGPGIRVDSGFAEGDDIPSAYDSLIAKLIAWGPTREDARRRMLRALGEYEIEGVPTTIPAHHVLMQHERFVDGSYTTRTVEDGALGSLSPSTAAPATDDPSAHVLTVQGTAARLWNPAMAGAATAATGGGSVGGRVVAPMHGTILKVLVTEGDLVEAGDAVAILETMKMEAHVVSSVPGAVKEISVEPGTILEAGHTIAVIG